MSDNNPSIQEPREVACLENNQWTPILDPHLEASLPLVKKLAAMDPQADVASIHDDPFTLSLAEVDATEYQRIHDSGQLVFHIVGCSGDPDNSKPQDNVARGMVSQVSDPKRPIAFFYHLGDIAYKPEPPSGNVDMDQHDLYSQEFYTAYKGYSRRIFAIAGNHDGKYHKDKTTKQLILAESPMWHFLLNFCAVSADISPDNGDGGNALADLNRKTMTQPYPYWILNTPVAYIIGLYANVANGGNLDDPGGKDYPHGPQYRWLVNRLKAIGKDNEDRTDQGMNRKAVLIAVHYPPYSGTTDFVDRGDPKKWNPKKDGEDIIQYANAQAIGNLLQEAFRESAVRPDAVFSAHAHLYQRLTYTYKDGQETPYLIVGSGGHAPIEQMGAKCEDALQKPPPYRDDPALGDIQDRLPPGLVVAPDKVELVVQKGTRPQEQNNFGFMRVTVTAKELTGEYFLCTGGVSDPQLFDTFKLALTSDGRKNAVLPL